MVVVKTGKYWCLGVLTLLVMTVLFVSEVYAQPAFGRNIPTTRLQFSPLQQSQLTFRSQQFNRLTQTGLNFAPFYYPTFNRPAVPYSRGVQRTAARTENSGLSSVARRSGEVLLESTSQPERSRTGPTRIAREIPAPSRERLRIVQQIRNRSPQSLPQPPSTRIAAQPQRGQRFQ